MDSRIREYLQSVKSDCIECGLCTRVQKSEGQIPLTYGEIATKLLDAQAAADAEGRPLKGMDIPEDVYDFARGCLLCGRCTAHCPVDIRASKAGMAARAVIGEAMPRVLDEYRRYRCDLDDAMFNRMREARGGHYDEFLPRSASQIKPADSPKTLFFPGCTLANNMPELCQAVDASLKKNGIVDCTTSFCCGRPLSLMGKVDSRDEYSKGLCDRIVGSGVTKVVAGCPNCFYTLREVFEQQGISDKVELEFLSVTLANAGYRFEPSEKYPYQKVAFHDSCPDRHDQIIAKSLRTIFENVEVVELEQNRLDSICCGSGGFGSVYGQTIPQSTFGLGVSEFFDTRAKCLVCACATCTSAYAMSGAVNCKHYLELLFGADIDVAGLSATLDELWNPDNPNNIGVYTHDAPFFVE